MHFRCGGKKIYNICIQLEKMQTLSFTWSEVSLEQTHFIVTFHYDGVVLSLQPYSLEGAEQQGCLTGGERRLVGYREDLIVLWHPQNDIIAVWFHDNNNLQSSCINI